MEAFTMEVAGLVVRVQPLFQSTKEYCRPYLSGGQPELFVTISPEDLLREQEQLELEAVEEGLKIRKFKEPFLERSVIQRRVAYHLAARDTLMLHGSTVAVDGWAYLFTAPCGTGKSTHTRLWREYFGDRAIMVNDDKPFLQIRPDGVYACGSPWSGKHGLATNICVPLKGICFLTQGKVNQICRAERNAIMERLYPQVHVPADEALAQRVRLLVEDLPRRVHLWEMTCNKDPDAARVAYCAMSAEKIHSI